MEGMILKKILNKIWIMIEGELEENDWWSIVQGITSDYKLKKRPWLVYLWSK